MTMTVQSHKTPNPNARKFTLPGKRFSQSLNFSSPETAMGHPLAQRLFALPGVYNVFMAQDFITVNKLPGVEWDALEKDIQSTIAEYFDL
jgi:hypothetical protein